MIPARAASGHSAAVSVSNLETWSQLAQENDPVRGSLEFLTTTANRMDSPRPSDFAIKSAGSLKVGADPDQVGPLATRPRAVVVDAECEC